MAKEKFQAILAYDGDGCGRKVGRAIIANDEKGLSEISAKIDLGQEIVKHWAKSKGGSVISGGGDEGTFQIPSDALEDVEQLRKDFEFATGITISVGIGETLSEAGRALLAAKFRGKNQIAYYDDSVEKDISTARKRVKKGKASQEEYKLSEAYLEKGEKMPKVCETHKNKMSKAEPTDVIMNEEKEAPAATPAPDQSQAPSDGLDDCPYCAQTDGVDTEHCQYCHEMDAAEGEEDCPYCAKMHEGTEEDCPYCQEMDHEHTGDDCPYCAEAQGKDGITGTGPLASNPTTTDPANYAGQDLNPPEIDKPDSTTAASQLMGQPLTPPAGGEIAPPTGQGIPEEDTTSRGALQSIAAQIADPNAQPSAGTMDQIDTADMSAGTQMEGNVSRPAGYDGNVPEDMGLAEDSPAEESPDLSGVLQEGLDSHADNIQREKVVQMVSEALQGFKASKGVLEKAKEQAPQLYQSSIAMLKAMIEMAKMMGLGEESSQGSVGPQGDQVVQDLEGQGGDDWKDPFPTHPDHGGQAKPGHAPSAAAQGDAAQAPKAVRQ